MTIFSFIDVETTGLDPVDDFILEVAWVLTDEKFNQLTEPKTFLIKQDDDSAVVARLQSNPFVIKMHQKSGLWVDMAVSPGVSLDAAMTAFVEDVEGVRSSEDMVRFAGYSVSFDKEFLRVNGWRTLLETKDLAFQLHHRIMDLSSCIQLYEAAGRQIPNTYNENPHRALEDALDALNLAQLMKEDLA